jgi:hypothetical protein
VTVFHHSGKLGDIIWSLPLIRHMGGGDLHIEIGVIENGLPRLTIEGYHFLKPLLEAQTYVRSVHVYAGGTVDMDLDRFRQMIPWMGCNLVDAYYLAHGIKPDPANHVVPWLEVPAAPMKFNKRVVVSRTKRYLGERPHSNPSYHQMIRQGLGEYGVFIGFPDEHAWFEQLYHVKIEHVRPVDGVGVAALVAFAGLWIGNENFVGAIAEALKRPAVRELVATDAQEKMYCAFRRPDLFYI